MCERGFCCFTVLPGCHDTLNNKKKEKKITSKSNVEKTACCVTPEVCCRTVGSGGGGDLAERPSRRSRPKAQPAGPVCALVNAGRTPSGLTSAAARTRWATSLPAAGMRFRVLELPTVGPHLVRRDYGVFHRKGSLVARGNKLKLLVTGLESNSGTGERYHQEYWEGRRTSGHALGRRGWRLYASCHPPPPTSDGEL